MGSFVRISLGTIYVVLKDLRDVALVAHAVKREPGPVVPDASLCL